MLEEEVDQALGCRSYERAEDRRGYRNGAETRRVTMSVGTQRAPGATSPRARRGNGRNDRVQERAVAPRIRTPELVRSTRRSWWTVRLSGTRIAAGSAKR